MKTQVTITIEHPDNMSADWVVADVIVPFINDVNADSDQDWKLSISKILFMKFDDSK